MSVLTKKERDGLEDVYLSIQSDSSKYAKLKDISTLILSHSNSINFSKLIKQAKFGLKNTKLSQYILNISKKKK